ncbi:hypothetical protein PENSPDRAFT_693426 [Peniophora sp. CONT]|nr:hypothetical protein PENSPDRAFT_693426 [Peniophora sp. CONT]
MKLGLWPMAARVLGFAAYISRVLHLRLYAVAIALPLVEWLIGLLLGVLTGITRVLIQYLLPFLPHALLGSECLLGLVVLVSFPVFCTSEPLTLVPRSYVRHPVHNVFIYGLSPRVVLLRVPHGATTQWILHELERRRLVPSSCPSRRLGYELLLSRTNGTPHRLLDFQDLEAAGLHNNSAIHVRTCVRGGSSDVRQTWFQCEGPCGRRFSSVQALRQHWTLSPRCNITQPAGETSIGSSVTEKLASVASSSVADAVAQKLDALASGDRSTGAHPASGPARADRYNTNLDGDEGMDVDPPPWDENGDERGDEDGEEDFLQRGRDQGGIDDGEDQALEAEDPLGWGAEDIARAERIGRRARGPEDVLFDEEEEQAQEEEELDRRILDGDGDGDGGNVEGGPEAGDAGRGANGGPGAGVGGDGGGGPGDDPDDGGGADGNDADEAEGDQTPEPDAAPPPPPPQVNRRIEQFGGRAGEPLYGGAVLEDGFAKYESMLPQAEDASNPYHPFATKMDWDIAAWAKNFGIGANALTALLKIDGVADSLGVQFRSNTELNKIFDKCLPPRSEFFRRTKKVAGEKHVLYMRDSLSVLREIYGRPDFAKDMIYAPEKHYVQQVGGIEERSISDMHTARWWWNMQKRFEEAGKPNATIVPIITSSDKTQLTLFRNRSAYPVYLTIGNLPKELRRKTSLQAQVLIGYLPVTSLKSVTDDDLRRRLLANLFHDCMHDILTPLRKVARDGVILTSGDGVRRRCYPLLAAFVGDYPEQVLVTGVKSGLCPKGTVAAEDRGEQVPCPPRSHAAAAAAYNWLDEHPNDPEGYLAACGAAGVKPGIRPFWTDYPHANIYQSITSDILHQLYQGMIKHLISWLKHVYGTKELDERFKRLPDNHQLRLFSKGISNLSRVSGSEHQDICRVLLGVIVDIPLEANARRDVLEAVRALLDFVYIAQFPEATMSTIAKLQDALDRFHQHKEVFITLGARANFNFPKMHALQHYVEGIKLFGTPDNFNTAYSERLHIDCAKDAWRATNRKDEYPQMTLWLQRREQILAHTNYIRWRLAGRPSVKNMPRAPLPGAPKLKKKLANNPTIESISIAKAQQVYGADNLQRKLTEFIVRTKYPTFTEHQVQQVASTTILPFTTISTFHRLKFWHPDALERAGDLVQELPDSIVARPAYRDRQKRRVQGAFNTALIDELGNGKPRVGQVRVIFTLSERARNTMFGDQAENFPTHFAYVEWFSRFRRPERWHGLHRVSRSIINNARVQNERAAVIVPVERIQRSVSLIPRFGQTVNSAWTSDNVLELCSDFYRTARAYTGDTPYTDLTRRAADLRARLSSQPPPPSLNGLIRSPDFHALNSPSRVRRIDGRILVSTDSRAFPTRTYRSHSPPPDYFGSPPIPDVTTWRCAE